VIAETDWAVHGVCRTTDPDELFVEGAAQNQAKAICSECEVRTECLAHALDNRIEHGIWGGHDRARAPVPAAPPTDRRLLAQPLGGRACRVPSQLNTRPR
jgi:WhiB family redox-sensing transcriptional regulator